MLYPTQYGRCGLSLYGDLARRALRRLADIAPTLHHPDSRPDGNCGADIRGLLAEALRRKSARLESVFPGHYPHDYTDEALDAAALWKALCHVTARWIDGVAALADDNELDVRRTDLDGRDLPTFEIVIESIIDDAVLAGRLARIRTREYPLRTQDV